MTKKKGVYSVTMLKAIKEARHIVIIGGAATGKSTLASSLKEPVIHTDDYIKYGFENALYIMMDHAKLVLERGDKLIIEGIQGFRYLRKVWELGLPKPDLVIHCLADYDSRYNRLKARKNGAKPRSSIAFDGMLYKIFKDWERASTKDKPKILIYDSGTEDTSRLVPSPKTVTSKTSGRKGLKGSTN